MCGAPDQSRDLSGVDLDRATVIAGQVIQDGAPVPAAFVRLLDSSGEFTAEVVSGATGEFRFFVAPGPWTVRVLTPMGTGESRISASTGLNETELVVTPA